MLTGLNSKLEDVKKTLIEVEDENTQLHSTIQGLESSKVQLKTRAEEDEENKKKRLLPKIKEMEKRIAEAKATRIQKE
jgi:predicted nuclease with TOPRIM domain